MSFRLTGYSKDNTADPVKLKLAAETSPTFTAPLVHRSVQFLYHKSI